MKLGISPLQGSARFEETVRECEQAEAAGFDSVWLGEHHNHPVLYPAPLIGLAAIASRTHRIELGTGVLLLPLYHPVAVAEEAAMVDNISGGRLILGVGAGYAPEEFRAFGLSVKQRGSRLDEAATLLRRLWTETGVTHHGKHFSVDDVTIGPRPVQAPRPPLWFGAWTEPAIRRAARLGDAWLGGPSAKLTEVVDCVQLYRAACEQVGRAPGEIALFRYVFVGETHADAAATAGKPFIDAFESMYFRWPHPVVKRPAGALDIQSLAENRIILGSPKECIEQILHFQLEAGLTHLICRFSVPGITRERSLASMTRFTNEVLPALRSA